MQRESLLSSSVGGSGFKNGLASGVALLVAILMKGLPELVQRGSGQAGLLV